MHDWSTRDHVTLPNSKWRQYPHRLFIPVEIRLIAAQYEFQVHIRIFLHSLDFLLFFFTYSCGIRSLRCSRFGRFTRFNFGLHLFKRSLFTITKDNNISEKSGVTRKNGLQSTAQCSGEIRHYGSFEIAQRPGSYLTYFFCRKDKAKLCFLQQDFLIYKEKLEYELNEL